jgi:amino acid transporter
MLVSDRIKKRVLSVFSLVMINVIAIDSLRNLPSNAETGLSIAFFYLLAGVLFLLPCALITAELATHHPKTGGAYIWVREAFGVKWGFMAIWLQWIYNVVWYPTILSFIAVNIAYLFNPALANNKFYMISMILGMFSIATIVNIFGMKISALVSTASAIFGTLIPMVLIIVLGIFWVIGHKALAIQPTVSSFFPHINNIGNLAFLVVVIFSLMGLEMSAVHAEEVKNPERNYPRALYISSAIILLTLILASAAIAIVVPKNELNIISGLDQAYGTFLLAFHLKWLLPIMILLIILGSFGGMAAWVIGPTKGLVVAAHDGHAPKWLQQRNPEGAPVKILLLQWFIVLAICVMMIFVQYISASYWILSDLTAQLALLFYIIFFAAAIRLRYKTPVKKNAYRIPFGNVGIWVVGLTGILASFFALMLGFLPPDGVAITNIYVYEGILVVGILIFALPPLFIHQRKK